MNLDTIAAISTPMGEGGIAIIRISGDQAISIVDKIFLGMHKLGNVDSHTIHYGHITDRVMDKNIEEVMVSVMKAPRTYTCEDVVEVNCHGGIVTVQRVLEFILDHGARLAEPGEFTKRAFLNGRLDLSQAEGVIDLIRSKTDKAMNVALQQVEGRLSHQIVNLRQELIEVLAHIEVSIDYPEHDVEDVTYNFLLDKCTYVLEQINLLLQTAEQGKILREGLKTAIIGRPNVGKSSLLNTLAHENRSIVTDIPGTTRDVIEEYVNIRGVPLQLIDTAGIRETNDLVEQLGVERSRKVLSEADLILMVLNNAEPLTDEDRMLFDLVKDIKTIFIVNKTDLPAKLDIKELKELQKDTKVVKTSLLKEQGIDEIEQFIHELYFSGNIEAQDLTYVSNARHIALLQDARRSIHDTISGLKDNVPIDIVQIDIQKAWESLGEIIGEAVSESLIDQLFSQFCLGK